MTTQQAGPPPEPEPWFARLKEAGLRLSPAVRDELRLIHHDVGWGCVAAAEGQRCCMDHLLAVQP